MEKNFLSYTHRPGPDYDRETDRLARAGCMAIKTLACA